MKIKKFLLAFTLIELLVVISIIAILAGIALPVFSQVQIKGAQTKALSNAKQIGLALKVYATDNNGLYPAYVLSGSPLAPTTQLVPNSSYAFAQLFPQYLTNETIFWLAKAADCLPTPPNNQIDNPSVYPPVSTLTTGQNHWAYVPGLYDTSNPSFPMIADCFVTATTHTYSTNQTAVGGVWSGQKAVVINVDCSGAILPVDQASLTVLGQTGAGTPTDIFQTSSTWLANSPVNPAGH